MHDIIIIITLHEQVCKFVKGDDLCMRVDERVCVCDATIFL